MRILPAVCLALAAAGPAGANELGNGDFDTDTVGWGTIEPVTFLWDSFDIDASPTSGSMELETHPPMTTMDFHGADSECVSVSPGDPVEVAAWAYIPSAQSAALPQAAVGLKRFTLPGCHPAELEGIEAGPITQSVDQWVELGFDTVIPGGVASAQVYVQGRNGAGGNQGSTFVFFDAVVLPEPDGLAAWLAAIGLLAALAGHRETG